MKKFDDQQPRLPADSAEYQNADQSSLKDSISLGAHRVELLLENFLKLVKEIPALPEKFELVSSEDSLALLSAKDFPPPETVIEATYLAYQLEQIYRALGPEALTNKDLRLAIRSIKHDFAKAVTWLKGATPEVFADNLSQPSAFQDVFVAGYQQLTAYLKALAYVATKDQELVTPIRAVEVLSVLNHDLTTHGIETKLSIATDVADAKLSNVDLAAFLQFAKNILDLRELATKPVCEISLDVDSNNRVCITVADDGPGIRDKDGMAISKNQLVNIFGDYSTKSEGGGFGLQYAMAIFSLRGASLAVVTRPEFEGTKFTVSLPVCQ